MSLEKNIENAKVFSSAHQFSLKKNLHAACFVRYNVLNYG